MNLSVNLTPHAHRTQQSRRIFVCSSASPLTSNRQAHPFAAPAANNLTIHIFRNTYWYPFQHWSPGGGYMPCLSALSSFCWSHLHMFTSNPETSGEQIHVMGNNNMGQGFQKNWQGTTSFPPSIAPYTWCMPLRAFLMWNLTWRESWGCPYLGEISFYLPNNRHDVNLAYYFDMR